MKSEILLNRKAFAFNMFQSSFQKVTFHIMFKTASGTSNRVVALTRLASLDRSAECTRDPRVDELLKATENAASFSLAPVQLFVLACGLA